MRRGVGHVSVGRACVRSVSRWLTAYPSREISVIHESYVYMVVPAGGWWVGQNRAPKSLSVGRGPRASVGGVRMLHAG